MPCRRMRSCDVNGIAFDNGLARPGGRGRVGSAARTKLVGPTDVFAWRETCQFSLFDLLLPHRGAAVPNVARATTERRLGYLAEYTARHGLSNDISEQLQNPNFSGAVRAGLSS